MDDRERCRKAYLDSGLDPNDRMAWYVWRRAWTYCRLSPQWVDVREALPEVGTTVLVHNASGCTSDCRDPMCGFLDDDGKWYSAYLYADELAVTHWQPLPAAPKEG